MSQETEDNEDQDIADERQKLENERALIANLATSHQEASAKLKAREAALQEKVRAAAAAAQKEKSAITWGVFAGLRNRDGTSRLPLLTRQPNEPEQTYLARVYRELGKL